MVYPCRTLIALLCPYDKFTCSRGWSGGTAHDPSLGARANSDLGSWQHVHTSTYILSQSFTFSLNLFIFQSLVHLALFFGHYHSFCSSPFTSFSFIPLPCILIQLLCNLFSFSYFTHHTQGPCIESRPFKAPFIPDLLHYLLIQEQANLLEQFLVKPPYGLSLRYELACQYSLKGGFLPQDSILKYGFSESVPSST